MSYIKLYANNVALPSPTSLSRGYEKIWSSNTGRSVTAMMVGDIIANKYTFSINWEMLTQTELDTIQNNLGDTSVPFVTFKLYDVTNGTETQLMNINVYSATINADYLLGGGNIRYRTASTEVIQI